MKHTIILLTVLCSYGCHNKTPEKTGFEGTPLPEFNLLLSDSSTFNTRNIPAGRPIALFWFGPYCPYSKLQMEEIVNHIERLKKMRFYIFTSYSFKEMKSFNTYYHLNKYKNITTGIDSLGYFANYFRAKGFPYIAIYSKNKKLEKAYIGIVSHNILRRAAGI
jgi:hypothetical protein